MYMYFYNSGELWNPPFYGTKREKKQQGNWSLIGMTSTLTGRPQVVHRTCSCPGLPEALRGAGGRTPKHMVHEEPQGKSKGHAAAKCSHLEGHSDFVAQDTFPRCHEKRPRCVQRSKY